MCVFKRRFLSFTSIARQIVSSTSIQTGAAKCTNHSFLSVPIINPCLIYKYVERQLDS